MATGGPDSWEFGVAWDGVTYVDESSRLLADDGKAITITRGAAEWATQPGVLAGALDNSDGRFTPDNPLSPLRAALPDAPTRMRVVKSGTTYTRHWGRISLASPHLDEQGDYTSLVTPFLSTDVLGQLMGRTMRAEYVERWIATGRTEGVDILPLDRLVRAPRSFSNLGNRGATARMQDAPNGLGTAATAAPSGIMLDAAVTVTQTNGSGPIVLVELAGSATPVEIVIPFRTADRIKAGKGERYIAQGLDSAGGEEWSLRLTDNAGVTDLRFYDSTGGSALVYGGFAEAGDSALGDDQWYALRVRLSGATQTFQLHRIADQSLLFVSTSAGYDVGRTRKIVLGGNRAGRPTQVACTTASYGAVAIKHTGTSVGHVGYLQPGATEPGQTRVDDLRFYADVAATIVGTRSREVALRSTSGRTVFDSLAELALTTGGAVLASRAAAGTIRFEDSDAVRGAAVVLTIDLEQDAGATLPWAKVGTPSRVTAAHPAGEAIYEDTTRERVDASIETCAANDVAAREVASWVANTGRRLRLTEITVDLAGASNDLWAAVMALEVGDRVRVNLGTASSPLVAQYGWTYVDHWVTGWTERYARDVAEFDLLLMPADDPVEGVFDDATRGRFGATRGSMTVTGGTAVGTTGTGTIVVTTTGGAPTWSTAAGSYPLDVDWSGERVTVTSPPASATSPQTLTITARGVAPSVARVHSTGEPVDVWLEPTFTI
jgi:hypothetical protein